MNKEQLKEQLNKTRQELNKKGVYHKNNGNTWTASVISESYNKVLTRNSLTSNLDIFELLSSKEYTDETIIDVIVNDIFPTKEVKVLQESIEKKKLNEGTSNFGHLKYLPLLVFYNFEEFMDIIRNDSDYPVEEMFADENNNIDENAYWDAIEKFEQKCFDENNVCILDEDDKENLENELYDFNKETENIAYEKDLDEDGNQKYENNLSLEDIKLKINSGYYEGSYIDCDGERYFDVLDEDFKEEQLKRFNDFLKDLKKKYNLTQLGVSARFSNGEVWYDMIKDEEEINIKEPTLQKEDLKEAVNSDIQSEINGLLDDRMEDWRGLALDDPDETDGDDPDDYAKERMSDYVNDIDAFIDDYDVLSDVNCTRQEAIEAIKNWLKENCYINESKVSKSRQIKETLKGATTEFKDTKNKIAFNKIWINKFNKELAGHTIKLCKQYKQYYSSGGSYTTNSITELVVEYVFIEKKSLDLYIRATNGPKNYYYPITDFDKYGIEKEHLQCETEAETNKILELVAEYLKQYKEEAKQSNKHARMEFNRKYRTSKVADIILLSPKVEELKKWLAKHITDVHFSLPICSDVTAVELDDTVTPEEFERIAEKWQDMTDTFLALWKPALAENKDFNYRDAAKEQEKVSSWYKFWGPSCTILFNCDLAGNDVPEEIKEMIAAAKQESQEAGVGRTINYEVNGNKLDSYYVGRALGDIFDFDINFYKEESNKKLDGQYEDTNESLKEMYDDFVIEDKFIEYMKSKGIKNPKVFNKDGFFIDGVYEKYAQGVADTYLDGNIDWLDGLCNEEKCFRDEDDDLFVRESFKESVEEKSLGESKKLEEAPDEFGILTDDELDELDKKELADLQAKMKARRDELAKDREAAASKKKEEDEKLAALEKAKEEGKKVLAEIEKTEGEDFVEKAFDILVPSSGSADTLGGELIRAINKIMYRDFNDGDVFYEGYGIETCGAPATFIAETIPECDEKLIEIATDALEDDDYTDALKEIADIIENYIRLNPEILVNKVNVDMYNSDEDYWKEYAPTYETEIELPEKLKAYLDKGIIPEETILWDIEEFEGYDKTGNEEFSIEWGDNLYIQNLSREGKRTWEEDGYSWLEDYAMDLEGEYGDPNFDIRDELEVGHIIECFPVETDSDTENIAGQAIYKYIAEGDIWDDLEGNPKDGAISYARDFVAFFANDLRRNGIHYYDEDFEFAGITEEQVKAILRVLGFADSGYHLGDKDNEDEIEAKESLKEDTVKQGNAWVNKGKEGAHGKFKTKKEADAQRKAMFAKGYKEELNDSSMKARLDKFIADKDELKDEKLIKEEDNLDIHTERKVGKGLRHNLGKRVRREISLNNENK